MSIKEERSWQIKRRNSVIEFVVSPAGNCVKKTYHAKYTVQEELDAFEKLKPCMERLQAIRLIEIYKIDLKDNALVMEFVDAQNLKEVYLKTDKKVIRRLWPELVQLFVSSRDAGIQFDADPTNFLYEEQAKALVLVDPVAQSIAIKDHAVTVFLWGYLKTFLADRKIWRFRSFCEEWRELRSSYMEQAGVTELDMNAQLKMYIDQVIDWNLNESSGESLAKRCIRRWGFVPAYKALKLAFRT